MEDATSTLQSAGRSAASVANDFGRRAREVADRAGEAAGRAEKWVREQKLAETATSYVLENPAKAIGVAVVAGAVLAMLFSRRRNWP